MLIQNLSVGQTVKFVYKDKVRIGRIVPPAEHVSSNSIVTLHCIEPGDDGMGELVYKSFKKQFITELELLLGDENEDRTT